MFYVSRQHDCEGELFVELETGGLDYAGPDMLVDRYRHLGEGREYVDPRDAARAAVAIRAAWRVDEPGETIGLSIGSTGGGLVYHTPSDPTDDEVLAWGEDRAGTMPKCPHCGEIADELDWRNGNSDWTGDKFCSEECAIKAQEADEEHLYELDAEEFGTCECGAILDADGNCPECDDEDDE